MLAYRTNIIRSIISAVFIMISVGTVTRSHAQNDWHEIALLGHGSINQMSLSPDGKILATGGSLGIWLYDVETLEPLKLLQPYHVDVVSFAFSPDGTQIAALGNYPDTSIRVWNIETETELLNIAPGEERYFLRLALSPDGKMLATTSTDSTVQIWDVATGNELNALTGFDQIQEITFSPDSSLLLFGERVGDYTTGGEGYLHVWDVANQQELTALEAPVINKILYSPDGAMVAATSEDYNDSLTFWNSETWQPIPQTGNPLSYDPLLPLAFSQDGQWLATASYTPQGANLGSEGTLILANNQNLEEYFYLGTHPTHIVDVVFSQDGRTLFSASEEGVLKVWDVETRTELATQPVIGTLSAAFAPDGQTFAVASDYRIVQLWDTSTVSIVKTLQGENIGYGEFRPQESSVMFSPDGSLLVASEGYNAFLWEVETGNLRGSFSPGWSWTITPTGFAADGQSFAVTNYLGMGGDTYTTSIDIQTVQPIEGIHASAEAEGVLTEIAISSDGRFDALESGGVSADGTPLALIYLAGYDPISHEHSGLTSLTFPARDVSLMQFSPDVQFFAAVDDKNTIHLWETEAFLEANHSTDTPELATLQGHSAPVTRLIFSPDGTRLASADEAGTIRVWDISNGSELANLSIQDLPLGMIIVSPTWTGLAVSDSNNTIHLWDLNTQTELATFEREGMGQLAFSPDGQTFIYEDAENRLHLWDINTKTEIALLDGHVGSLRDLVFSPDSQTLLTVGNDSSIRVWRQGE